VKPRSERNARRLRALEAALYAAGRPIDVEDLKPVAGTRSDRVIRRLVNDLAKNLKARGGALEVKVLKGNRVILQLKNRYSKMVKRFTTRPLLTSGPLKTLSYVAYYQPVEQTQVVEDRGSHVYGHLRMMEEMGLITRERTKERSYIIRTTPFFADYFGFSQSPQKVKIQLRRVFEKMKITKLDNGNGEGEMDEGVAEFLADPGNGLPEGLPEYPRPANQGP